MRGRINHQQLFRRSHAIRPEGNFGCCLSTLQQHRAERHRPETGTVDLRKYISAPGHGRLLKFWIDKGWSVMPWLSWKRVEREASNIYNERTVRRNKELYGRICSPPYCAWRHRSDGRPESISGAITSRCIYCSMVQKDWPRDSQRQPPCVFYPVGGNEIELAADTADT